MFWIPLSLTLAAPLVQSSGMTEVTIYNPDSGAPGFGFVKEIRKMNLKAGRQEVSVEDVAAQIETNSVSIRSLTAPAALTVLEQNYQYDLISRKAILNKSVGGRIKLHRLLADGRRDTITGTLLTAPSAIISTPGGGTQEVYNGMVIRADSGGILLDPTGEIEIESLPGGLISKPTLVWDIENSQVGEHQVELSYLSGGLSWDCDYVMTLDDKSRKSDFRGWVTLNNQSGATWPNARLKLLAGDVQRVQPQNRGVMMMESRGAPDAPKAGGFSEEALFEYHLYTLQRPTNLRDRETKQISLLDTSGVPYQKKLIVDSMMGFGMYYPSEGEVGTGDIKPQVRIEFKNSKEGGLGVPLPKGRVKVYMRDTSGSVQMLGEDEIDHTPKDENLSLVVGRSFDVRASRKRTNFRRLGQRSFEETFEIEVRNRKESAETVHVYERHWGEWKVPQTSDKFEKKDSNTMEFVVNLAANQTKTIKYTVVTSW